MNCEILKKVIYVSTIDAFVYIPAYFHLREVHVNKRSMRDDKFPYFETAIFNRLIDI